MRLTLVSTKGGTGKTTSAVSLAMVLHRLGRTLAVDCDPQGSLMSWSEAAAEDGTSLPFTVVSLATRDVHVRLSDLAAGYDHVVVDTPPGDLGIIRSAILASSIVLVPVSPTGLDLNRIRPTFEALSEIAVSHPVAVGVLLTKVRRGTRSARSARGILAEHGYPAMRTEIPLAEHFAAAFGTVPSVLAEYWELLGELREVSPS
ncbi:MAG TPA: ParA family protein [Streptosporangiaceae bacterium]|nr:ParA family protein [Streptosporangiaceae bacterium]